MNVMRLCNAGEAASGHVCVGRQGARTCVLQQRVRLGASPGSLPRPSLRHLRAGQELSLPASQSAEPASVTWTNYHSLLSCRYFDPLITPRPYKPYRLKKTDAAFLWNARCLRSNGRRLHRTLTPSSHTVLIIIHVSLLATGVL